MKLLFVDCCISQRGADSRTRALADAFLNAFRAKHPEAEVETVSQETLLDLKPFDAAMLNDRDALASVGVWDAPVIDLARQFRAADGIAVAAPYWDLSFPAQLKIYIENIYATGIVTRYDAAGRPEGMCRAEELIYVTTSGGPFDGRFGYGYVKALAEDYFGISATRLLLAEGLDIQGNDPEAILQRVLAENGLTEA